MASVRGRTVQWTDPATRKRLTKTLASPSMAKRFASDRETESELVKGRFLDAKTLERGRHQWTPILQVIDEYEQELVKRRRSAKHRKETIRLLKKLAKDCNYQTLSDIDAGSLDAFLKGIIRQGLSAKTHNAYLKAVGALCRWLLGFRRIECDPTTPISSMDESQDKRRPSRAMTFDEVEALLKVAGPRRLYYLFRFRTGLRTQECRRLVGGDIDPKQGVLRLRAEVTKNGKADVLPLPGDLLDELRQRLVMPTVPVFTTSPTIRTWRSDLDRAKIEYLTPDGQADIKSTRMTFEADLLRAKADGLVVSLLMRHSLPGGLALTYGPYADPDAILNVKRQAVEKLDQWLRNQRAKAAVSSA